MIDLESTTTLSRFRIPPIDAVRVVGGWDITGDGKADFEAHSDVTEELIPIGTVRVDGGFDTGDDDDLPIPSNWTLADRATVGIPDNGWLKKGGWSYLSHGLIIDLLVSPEIKELDLPLGTHSIGGLHGGFDTDGGWNQDVPAPYYPSRDG